MKPDISSAIQWINAELECLKSALFFLRKHVLTVTILGLIAGLGRVIQLGGFGTISYAFNIFLEILINSARIVLFIYVLGFADFRIGLSRIKHFFTKKTERRENLITAWHNLKEKWPSVIVNFIFFGMIAALLNYLIDALAYETCLFLTLKEGGILSSRSSEWTILLFFKNLSVIPFTLIFEVLFILWISGIKNNVSSAHSKSG